MFLGQSAADGDLRPQGLVSGPLSLPLRGESFTRGAAQPPCYLVTDGCRLAPRTPTDDACVSARSVCIRAPPLSVCRRRRAVSVPGSVSGEWAPSVSGKLTALALPLTAPLTPFNGHSTGERGKVTERTASLRPHADAGANSRPPESNALRSEGRKHTRRTPRTHKAVRFGFSLPPQLV